MATLKLFTAWNTWAPGDDVARRAMVPSHALGSNIMTVVAQAVTKAEVRQMLVDYGVTPGRADMIMKDMRLHRDQHAPDSVARLREIGVMKGHGVWTHYEFRKDTKVFQLTESGPRHVADVQLWPLQAQTNVEPVNNSGYRLHWRNDGSMFSRYTGFLNGLPMFWIDSPYGSEATLRTDLPGWSHQRWECSDKTEAYELADKLLGIFVGRLGAAFQA